MSLITRLQMGSRRPRTRHPRALKPTVGVKVEALESRTVLSHASAAAHVAAQVADAVQTPQVSISQIQIDNVSLDQAGNLVANGTLTGTLNGTQFTQALDQIPLSLGTSPNPDITRIARFSTCRSARSIWICSA